MSKHRAAIAGLLVLGLGWAGSPAQAAAGYAAAGEPALPPAVSTGAASGVSQNAATLTGTVSTEGFETVYEFDLGTDTSYGTRIFGDAGAEPGTQTFAFALQGLAPSTAYHYRIQATNAFGTVYGADQTFTTSVYPSSVLSAPATETLVPTPLLAPANAGAAAVTTAGAAAHAARRSRAGRAGRKRSRGHRRAGAPRGSAARGADGKDKQ